MPTVFLAVGSNVGDRPRHLEEAKSLLLAAKNIRDLSSSSVYETEPVGGPPQGKYLNAVWRVETELGAEELLALLLAVEKTLGRTRAEKNAPRTMDLDILFYGNEIIRSSRLTVPHPRLTERGFVLRPLAELAPEWRHPQMKKSMRELLEEFLARNPKS